MDTKTFQWGKEQYFQQMVLEISEQTHAKRIKFECDLTPYKTVTPIIPTVNTSNII